jgi:hypothetical protein
MIYNLNKEESQIRRGLEKVREYPHWRYPFVTGSNAYKTFLLYTSPRTWVEEVAWRDGMWMGGSKWRGTRRFFSHLEDALFYAERLAGLPIQIKRPEKGILPQRHAPISIRDLAEEERLRREGVALHE